VHTIRDSSRIFNITFADDDGVFNSQTFVTELRNRKLNVENVTLDYRATETDLQKLFARLEHTKYDSVIFSSLLRARSGKGPGNWQVSLPGVYQKGHELVLQQRKAATDK